MSNVLIYDYGGNTGSLQRALKRLGAQVQLSRKPEAGTTHQILPGQGVPRMALGMEIEDTLPTLGICLGLQLMTEGSDEDTSVPGLGWFQGRAVKLPVSPLPHIGWNTIDATAVERDYRVVLAHIADFYFCHSYAVLDSNHQKGTTEYGGARFVSLVENGHHWGIQAHPEKSGDAGMEYLKGFLKL